MANGPKKEYQVHVILGTHSDREWRASFQQTRHHNENLQKKG